MPVSQEMRREKSKPKYFKWDWSQVLENKKDLRTGKKNRFYFTKVE